MTPEELALIQEVLSLLSSGLSKLENQNHPYIQLFARLLGHGVDIGQTILSVESKVIPSLGG